MPHHLIERPDGPRPLTIRAAAPGPCAGWALHNGPKQHKQKLKVLFLIGAYMDAGIRDPSIRELASRSGIDTVHVVAIVDWLERRGFVRIERSASERNRYGLAREGAPV